MLEKIVIVGAGQAASQACDMLRRKGFKGSLTLIGEEPQLPYQRPPLSKKFLAGIMAEERLLLRPAQFYKDYGITTLLGRRAVEIDRAAQRVRLDDGTELPYDALLLATGSRPRRLNVPGAKLAGVYYLRNIADVEAIQAEFEAGKRMVIIGGGYIGLEVAATATERGLAVTVLEMGERVMSRVTSQAVSDFIEEEHRRHDVRIVCNAQLRELRGDPHSNIVRSVVCENDKEYPADLVLIGVGAVAADELAVAAGLECTVGIVVDEFCRTSDPHIYAAGDCTSQPSLHYGGVRMRLESVDNAFEQGQSAALNMMGLTQPHDKVPWFWSDQYDVKLIIVGVSLGYDKLVIRGTPASRSFSVCYLRDGELIAVDTVNQPKDQMAARKAIAARIKPKLLKLGDVAVSLKDC